ncbi:MAG: adenosylcobinamide-GDP ribazoletransferase [Elusimicrobiota bacterium]
MKSFLFALRFLTVIPVKVIKSESQITAHNSTIFFPLVGLLLGAILSGANSLLSYPGLSPFLSGCSLTILLIILTGGLHLDGLSDTFDALGSYKDRESALQIMRDSHIGAIGVLSLISVILLKAGVISELISQSKNISVILMTVCIVSRWSMVLAMYLFPYARVGGKAKIFFEDTNLKKLLSATVLTFIIIFFLLKTGGILLIFFSGLFTYFFGKFLAGKFSGLTGDNLGAINELNELFLLLLTFFF